MAEGDTHIPETVVRVIILGEDPDGNYVPIKVDSEGRMTTAPTEEEEETEQM